MIKIYYKYTDNPKAISSAFLSDILSRECGISEPTKKLYRDAHGKPHIDSAVFSLSHSAQLICVAVVSDNKENICCDDVQCIALDADAKNLGVDIECCTDKKYDRCKNIAKSKFFTSEQNLLSKCKNECEYTDLFCMLWTKKESYSKYTGIGMKDALSFDTQKKHEGIEHFAQYINTGEQKYALSLCYNSVSEK